MKAVGEAGRSVRRAETPRSPRVGFGRSSSAWGPMPTRTLPEPSSRSSATTSSHSPPKWTRSRSGPEGVRSRGRTSKASPRRRARRLPGRSLTPGERDGAALLAAAESELERREPFAISVTRGARHPGPKRQAPSGRGRRCQRHRKARQGARVPRPQGDQPRGPLLPGGARCALFRLASLDAALKGASCLQHARAHPCARRAHRNRRGRRRGGRATGSRRGGRPAPSGVQPRCGEALRARSRGRSTAEALVRCHDPVGIAVRNRRLEPTRKRLDGRAVAQVLEALPGGRTDPLLLLLDVRHRA